MADTTNVEKNERRLYGDWLRDRLHERKMSATELARRIDRAPSYILGFINHAVYEKTQNLKNPSQEVAADIAHALNTDPKLLKDDVNEGLVAAGYAPITSACISYDTQGNPIVRRFMDASTTRINAESSEALQELARVTEVLAEILQSLSQINAKIERLAEPSKTLVKTGSQAKHRPKRTIRISI